MPVFFRSSLRNATLVIHSTPSPMFSRARKLFKEPITNPRICNWSYSYSSTAARAPDGLLRFKSSPTRPSSSPISPVASSNVSRTFSSLNRFTISNMSAPVARDFQLSRASTGNIEATTRYSIDLEAANRRRHHTLSPESFKASRARGQSISSVTSDGGIQRRVARQETIRNYHPSPTRPTWEEPGAEPGIDTNKEAEPHFSHLLEQCQVTVVDFSDEKMEKWELDNEGLIEFLNAPKPEWMTCRWVNVNGLSWDVIKALGNANNLHRLAIEDLMNTRGRTKADWYSDHAFSKCYLLFC
jgi:hypothetical protein